MCREASLQRPEIRRFCTKIEARQKEEVDWMRAKLQRMK
jgi:hypothetical protein